MELILCAAAALSGTLSKGPREVSDWLPDPGFGDPEITPAIEVLDVLLGRELGGNIEFRGALEATGAFEVTEERELRAAPLAEDIELGLDAGVLIGDFVGD